MASEITFKNENHGLSVTKGMEYLLDKGNDNFCDIKVVSGEKVFNCQSMVMVSYSYYFSDLQCYDQLKGTVDISDFCSAETFQHVLNFIYKGEFDVPADKIGSFMNETKLLRIETLQSALEKINSSNSINKDTVIDLSCQSFDANIDASKTLCLAYLCSNFKDIVREEKFKDISYDVLSSLLISDDIRAESEDKVLDAVLLWANEQPEERAKSFTSLLKDRIRHGCLTYEKVVTLLREKVVKINHEAVEFVSELLEYFVRGRSPVPYCQINEDVRIYEKRECSNIVLIGSKGVRAFDLEDKSWGDLAPLPVELIHPVAAVVEDVLYVVGGGKKPVLLSYNFMNRDPVWRSRPAMTLPRRKNFGMAVIKENLYIIGGMTDDGPTKSVEYYDSRRMEWSSLPDLPVALSGAAVCTSSSGDEIYCFGGRTGPGCRDIAKKIYKYDNWEEKWTDEGSLIEDQTCAAAVSIAGRIFIIGGINCDTFVHTISEYLPSERAVVKRAEFGKDENVLFNAFPYNDKIYFIRGSRQKYMNGIKAFDIGNYTFSDIIGEFKDMKEFAASILKLKK